ncbi:hypothetical protein [Geminocystis sp.]|uniref:hypothetical protein n=1 Tax=Geminocystis sp. TaxID=2664100 RepID=UPI003593BA56
MINRNPEPVKWIPRFAVTQSFHEELKQLQQVLGRPMAEINREGLTLILQKYSKQ